MSKALDMLFSAPVLVAIALSRLITPMRRLRGKERRKGRERRSQER